MKYKEELIQLTEEQKQNIIREEDEFPKLFTNYVETEYGILFFNEENKDSYDSNHAIIDPERITDLAEVLQQITTFYQEKGLTPLIYHPPVKDYLKENEAVFRACGYQVTIEERNRVALLTEVSTIVPDGSLEVRQLTAWDPRIGRDILIPNNEAYEIPVGERSMNNENSRLFVGYVGDKAVVYVIFHVSPYGTTRFDYVDTAQDERKKGYGRQISHVVMTYCREQKLPLCATWFANPTSERMNIEAGFRYTDLVLEHGYATYV